MFNTRFYGFWGALIEALRTGEPQSEAKQGGDVFAINPSPLWAATVSNVQFQP
jgi:hypothetical protein